MWYTEMELDMPLLASVSFHPPIGFLCFLIEKPMFNLDVKVNPNLGRSSGYPHFKHYITQIYGNL